MKIVEGNKIRCAYEKSFFADTILLGKKMSLYKLISLSKLYLEENFNVERA